MSAPARKLIAVRPELVREHLVEQIHAGAAKRSPAEIPDRVSEALERAFETVAGVQRAAAVPAETEALGATLARVGYLSRVVESEIFEPARTRMPWLSNQLTERLSGEERDYLATFVEVSRELALTEPDERPEPEGGHASWRVPGPGGHVRHYLALRGAQEHAPKGSSGEPLLPEGLREAGGLKRCWLFGFILRCCEEAMPPAVDTSRPIWDSIGDA